MNGDQTYERWMPMSGKLRERWGVMIEDEPVKSDGKRDQVAGLLSQQYGDAKATMEKPLRKLSRT